MYITLNRKIIFRKTFLYSFVFSFPCVFVFNYVATVSGAWWEKGTIGLKVLGAFPIDTFIWGFLYIYFVVSFYEYFFDNDRIKKTFSHRMKYLGVILALLTFVFGLIYYLNKDLFVIKYFYLLLILLIFIVPTILIIYRYPLLTKKVIYMGLYFVLFSFIYELSALFVGQWGFDKGGYFIGWLEIFSLRFAFEEFLWLVFAVPALILIYEFFADDRK